MIDDDQIPITVPRIIHQVDFRTDAINTTTSGETVLERRYTAWQGDKHVAPFSYSGKVMPRDDWSPIVLHIRNQLYNITGQYYDGCLLNLYHNGKSGMRYHSDPDQGTLWDYDTAVVSIGATRRFVFRSISPQQQQPRQQPHSFVVMDSDVTYMFRDCQNLYQHSLKNAEDHDETASRISLVFKRSYQYNHEAILSKDDVV
jgi:alkylated DNA repair dioxygenase AlkB